MPAAEEVQAKLALLMPPAHWTYEPPQATPIHQQPK
jgi:hypothetical protein